jgi:hypothetical protein
MSDPEFSQLDVTDEMIAERRGDGPMPPDMWMGGLAQGIDTFSLWVGRVACLFLIPMMSVVIIEVVGRKLFVAPTDYAYDLSRWSMGAMFMLGAGYALMKGVHIRADFPGRPVPVYHLFLPLDDPVYLGRVPLFPEGLDHRGTLDGHSLDAGGVAGLLHPAAGRFVPGHSGHF